MVPRADDMLLIGESALSITGMTQLETDCVAEKVSALVDDHLSVKVPALAVTDVEVELLIVKVTVGRVAGSAGGIAAGGVLVPGAVRDESGEVEAVGGTTGGVVDAAPVVPGSNTAGACSVGVGGEKSPK